MDRIFDNFLQGMFIMFLVITLVFGGAGYLIGHHVGYKVGIKDALNGKYKIEKRIDTTIIIKHK